ncbi:hypothetical protein BJ875DRAFT_227079 [Amylocarpus encephaloides]|uniref:Uncharacterized protein n=1 Tax=Amylocarpus encephaloides TaxID=45428 RepID=A0A9P7Y7S6_9HELO|nr:hypothetical protein BJ875DRAFT_227079 [Amylocarpus encephaloides]
MSECSSPNTDPSICQPPCVRMDIDYGPHGIACIETSPQRSTPRSSKLSFQCIGEPDGPGDFANHDQSEIESTTHSDSRCLPLLLAQSMPPEGVVEGWLRGTPCDTITEEGIAHSLISTQSSMTQDRQESEFKNWQTVKVPARSSSVMGTRPGYIRPYWNPRYRKQSWSTSNGESSDGPHDDYRSGFEDNGVSVDEVEDYKTPPVENGALPPCPVMPPKQTMERSMVTTTSTDHSMPDSSNPFHDGSRKQTKIRSHRSFTSRRIASLLSLQHLF